MSSLSQVLILSIPDFEGFSKNQDCWLVKGTFPYLLFMFLLYTIQLKVEGRSNDWMSCSCSRKESFMICRKRSCILMLSKLLRLPSQSQFAILSANIICPCLVMSITEETLELATESRYTLKSISLTRGQKLEKRMSGAGVFTFNRQPTVEDRDSQYEDWASIQG